MKKSMIILILFLIILLCTTPQSGNIKQSNRIKIDRAILYVGGNGPGNYSKIQDAIDDAGDGDTIRVYDGTYYENVIVDTRVNLIGNGSTNTIIDGGYADHMHVVYITANKVKISGFGLKNSYIGHEFGGLGVQSTNNIIFENHCWDNLYGAILFGDQNIVYNNSFSNNKRDGIFIKSSGNSIYNNICSNSSEDDGIWLYISNSNIVSNNTCSNNYMNGITLYQSHNNQIISNKCKKNILFNGILNYESSTNEFINNKLSYNNADGMGISHLSDNNTIINNYIEKNKNGIDLNDDSNNNIIKNNIILLNSVNGIEISSSTKNVVYHNNLYNNSQNALDTGYNNTWDNDYPSGGNYWDDYNGEDNNTDGIGDIPYYISGGINTDFYPLVYKWGENPPVTNFTYYYNNSTFDASSSYDRDGEIISYQWDFGDGTYGNGMIVLHYYNDSGIYDVVLNIKDNTGYEDNITKKIEIINQPPETPAITGQTQGEEGVEYEYIFNSTDSDDDLIMFIIDWGDNNTDLTEYVESGEEITLKHIWIDKGDYTIKAKAKDIHGAESEWGKLKLTMPKNKAFNKNIFFKKFLENHPKIFSIFIFHSNFFYRFNMI